MRAQDTRAIGAGRIDHDADLDVGILTLELRDHLRLRNGPWISCVVRVEERVVGDFDRLRERHRGYGDDDSEYGEQLGDALRPLCAASRAALTLMDCLHCFLRCGPTWFDGRIEL